MVDLKISFMFSVPSFAIRINLSVTILAAALSIFLVYLVRVILLHPRAINLSFPSNSMKFVEQKVTVVMRRRLRHKEINLEKNGGSKIVEGLIGSVF